MICDLALICADGEAFGGGNESFCETLLFDDEYLEGIKRSVLVRLFDVNDGFFFKLLWIVELSQSEWTTFNLVGEVNDKVEFDFSLIGDWYDKFVLLGLLDNLGGESKTEVILKRLYLLKVI